MYAFRNYLRYDDSVVLKIDVPQKCPVVKISPREVLDIALKNNPLNYSIERQLLEAKQRIAQARVDRGFKADIYASVGFTGSDNSLSGTYQNLQNRQVVSLGIRIPILDWGRGKGQVRVARSNRDLVYTQVEQSRTDFELNVRKLVKQFNLQSQRVHIAARTDETAQRRADVARRLYILGKSTVLDLNASISEKDAARRNYITALYNYWSLYYTLRSITLYDFEVDAPLTETERIEEVMDKMIKK